MDDLAQIFVGGIGVGLMYVGFQVFKTLLSKTPDPKKDPTIPLVDLASSLTRTFDTLTHSLNSLTSEVRDGIENETSVHQSEATLLQSLVNAASETANVLKTVVTELREMKTMSEHTKSKIEAEEREALKRHTEITQTQRQHTLMLDDIKKLTEHIKNTVTTPKPEEKKEVDTHA